MVVPPSGYCAEVLKVLPLFIYYGQAPSLPIATDAGRRWQL